MMDKRKKYMNWFILYALIFLSVLFLFQFIFESSNAQYNIFFLSTKNMFADFYNPIKYSFDKNPYQFNLGLVADPERAYPPFAYLLFYVFARYSNFSSLSALAAWQDSVLLTISIIFFSFIILLFFIQLYEKLNLKVTEKLLVIFVLFFSSVFLFSIERGNIVILSALLSSFYLFNYSHESKIVRESAFIALAMSAGIKIFPAIFGMLLIYEKRYLEAFRLVIYGLLFFFLPFLFFEGGFYNIILFFNNTIVSTLKYNYAQFPRYGFRYWITYLNNQDFIDFVYATAVYFQLILVLFSLYIMKVSKSSINRIFLLTLILMIFPVNSAQYNGLYLFVYIVLFLNRIDYKKSDIVYAILIFFFLNPYQFLINGFNFTLLLQNLSVSFMFLFAILNKLLSIKLQ